MTGSLDIPHHKAPGDDDQAVFVRRSLPRFLTSLVREPLSTIPTEAYDHPMVVTRIAGRERVYLTGPDLIQEAFVRQAASLSKGAANQVLEPALGQGLLTAEHAHWRWQRRALSPGFAHARLQGLVPAMVAAAEAMRDSLLSATHAPVDIGRETTRATLRIVGDTMLACAGDLDATRIENGLSAFLGSVPWAIALTLFGAPTWTPYPGRRRSLASARAMRADVLRLVAARRDEGVRDGEGDLMALLLEPRDPESGRGLTDDEITDNVVTFITAGHETTSVALTWTLQLLAEHPEVAARVRAEVDAVAGPALLAADHIARLTYTRQVLNEAMRLYPPAPVLSRTVGTPFTLGGRLLRAGTVIILPIYAVHRHRRLWERPFSFDPDRFAAAAAARHRYAFLPFGLGPRVCIGSAFAMLEAVAILAVLVRALDFSAEAPPPTPTARLTLRPNRPVMLRVTAR